MTTHAATVEGHCAVCARSWHNLVLALVSLQAQTVSDAYLLATIFTLDSEASSSLRERERERERESKGGGEAEGGDKNARKSTSAAGKVAELEV